jgi:hypothetical protein
VVAALVSVVVGRGVCVFSECDGVIPEAFSRLTSLKEVDLRGNGKSPAFHYDCLPAA